MLDVCATIPSMEKPALRLGLVAGCLVLSATIAPAQVSKAALTVQSGPATPTYAGEAVIVEQSEVLFRYNADGTGTEDMHVVAKVQNDAGAQQLSVISAAFASETQTAQMESLSVRHADGTTTVTPPSDAMELPAQVTQEAPLYSDLKVLQIPVRGLRSGDTLEYRLRITQTRPEAEHEFWNSYSFAKGLVIRAESLTLDVPAGLYIQVWSPKYTPVKSQADGRVVYRWTSSQLQATSGDKDKATAGTETVSAPPDMAWTTFHNWQEVGEWYRSLAAPKAVATAALQAQAEQITEGARTPEDQVKAIYAFVSSHIRYIGVDFGIGRYEPHAAAEVLANQYGDCKDKDTLLEALLHAKGFTTAPALIGAGIKMIPELPSPQLFNHVITTVAMPTGEIWLDSTPGVAPYQYLLPPIRDKQALVIPATGEAKLSRTPALAPYPFVDHFTATGTLKTDGEMDAHVVIEDRSDQEIALRAVARNVAPAQWDQGTQYLARLLGFSGTTSNSSFSHADDLGVPMRVSYDYVKKPYGDWDNLRIVPLFPVVELPAAPDKKPSSEVDLGAARTEIAETDIHLPPGYGANLPDAVHVKTPFATFDKTYGLKDGVLTIRRTIAVLESKLPAASWQQYAKFAKDASLGELTYIPLTAPSATGAAGSTATGSGGSAEAASLIQEAMRLGQQWNWAAAEKKLDEAKALQPDQAYLWASYAYAEMIQGDLDGAARDFRHELQLHPDETRVALVAAAELSLHHRDADASGLLSLSFNYDRSNTQVALLLADIESKDHLNDAITTLQTALQASPNNTKLMDELSSDLFRNNDAKDAAALAVKILAQADTPDDLNSGSYTLAETGDDLPLAEQKARQALGLLDSETSHLEIDSVTPTSMERAVLLVDTWDTLGYILMQENKLPEAQDYLEAAWRNEPDAAIGLHYGALLEKRGEKAAALRIYLLSQGGQHTLMDMDPDTPQDRQQLQSAIDRMRAAGVRTSIDDPTIELQNERTFHIAVAQPYDSFVSGTFQIQIGAGGVHDAIRMGGSESLEPAVAAIRSLKLPHLVPSGSHGLVLRRAVVACSSGEKRCELVLIPLGDVRFAGMPQPGAGE